MTAASASFAAPPPLPSERPEMSTLAWIFAVPVAALALAVLIYLARVWRRETATDRLPILCYHRLTCSADLEAGRIVDNEPVWTVLDTVFAEQMEHLAAAGYTAIDLDQLEAIRNGSEAAPDRPVLITFDDGYESVRSMALPVLSRLGLKAVVYAVLEPDEHTRNQVAGLDRIMTEEELAALPREVISVQSHTVTHCVLQDMADDEVRAELSESRRRLSELRGHDIRHFCVPRGGGNARVRELVIEAGYASCSGMGKGTARVSDDPHGLPRIGIERHHDGRQFARLLQPRHAAIHKAIGDLRLLPTRLLGARAGYALRRILYSRWLRPVFGPQAIARTLAAGVGLAVITGIWLASCWLRG